MIRLVREFRLVPVVLIAVTCLFVLKVVGLLLDGGYMLGGIPRVTEGRRLPAVAAAPPPPLKQSWAKQMFNSPDVTGSVANVPPRDKPMPSSDITGSVDAKPKEKPAEGKEA